VLAGSREAAVLAGRLRRRPAGWPAPPAGCWRA